VHHSDTRWLFSRLFHRAAHQCPSLAQVCAEKALRRTSYHRCRPLSPQTAPLMQQPWAAYHPLQVLLILPRLPPLHPAESGMASLCTLIPCRLVLRWLVPVHLSSRRGPLLNISETWCRSGSSPSLICEIFTRGVYILFLCSAFELTASTPGEVIGSIPS